MSAICPVAIIQARVGSTRLPRKVLEPLGEMPALEWVLRRVRRATLLSDVIVATTTRPEDENIVALCDRLNTKCFRGSEHDVLDRFVQAARWSDASHVVRVNADNPFIEPQFIDQLLADKAPVDYCSYQTLDGRPIMLTSIGFFGELITRDCLERAARDISDPHLREHVTLGIYRNPKHFCVKFHAIPEFAEEHRLRLTLDTSEDLTLLRELVSELHLTADTAVARSLTERISKRETWLMRMHRMNRRHQKS